MMKTSLKQISTALTFVIAMSWTTAQDFTFNVNLAGGAGETVLTAGFSPDATDGYDDGIDSYAPPAPPPPSFDAALSWGGDRYYIQILEGDGDLSEHV